MTRIALALTFILAMTAGTTAAPASVIDRTALATLDSFTLSAAKKKVKKVRTPRTPPAPTREYRGS